MIPQHEEHISDIQQRIVEHQQHEQVQQLQRIRITIFGITEIVIP